MTDGSIKCETIFQASCCAKAGSKIIFYFILSTWIEISNWIENDHKTFVAWGFSNRLSKIQQKIYEFLLWKNGKFELSKKFEVMDT